MTHPQTEWLATGADEVTWATREINGTAIHQVDLQNPVLFGTKGGQASDASLWFLMTPGVRSAGLSYLGVADSLQSQTVTYMVNTTTRCQDAFVQTGELIDGVYTLQDAQSCVNLHFDTVARLIIDIIVGGLTILQRLLFPWILER